MQHVRGFGDKRLDKLTFYVTLHNVSHPQCLHLVQHTYIISTVE